MAHHLEKRLVKINLLSVDIVIKHKRIVINYKLKEYHVIEGGFTH
jgi:hypothetical protein